VVEHDADLRSVVLVPWQYTPKGYSVGWEHPSPHGCQVGFGCMVDCLELTFSSPWWKTAPEKGTLRHRPHLVGLFADADNINNYSENGVLGWDSQSLSKLAPADLPRSRGDARRDDC
jgi:hypothetical protein